MFRSHFKSLQPPPASGSGFFFPQPRGRTCLQLVAEVRAPNAPASITGNS
jgi:hypothetical protein